MRYGAWDGERVRARGAVPAVRVVALVALVAAGTALSAACSSSSGAAQRTTPVATDTHPAQPSTTRVSPSASTPSTSAFEPAVAVSPTATATVRTLPDVAAAHQVYGDGCTGPEVLLDSWLDSQLYQHDAMDQKIVAHNSGKIARQSLRYLVNARKAWLAAGYPASYQVVKDITAERSAVAQLIPILRRADLAAITPVAARLYVAQKQYDIDVASAHHSRCAGI